MWQTLNPAVPRHWLFAIAGVLWTTIGILLCARAIAWLEPFTLGVNLLAETVGFVLAGVGYFYGFSRSVEKNINRIHALPEWACAFAFTPWKGYLMIGVMVIIGIALRGSEIPKYYLSVPYAAMGGMLLLGGVKLFRQFLASAYQGK